MAELRYFEVIAMPQAPAWDEKDGYRYEVWAKSKSDANAQARRQAYNDGHTVGRRFTFTAREIPAPPIIEDEA